MKKEPAVHFRHSAAWFDAWMDLYFEYYAWFLIGVGEVKSKSWGMRVNNTIKL